MRQMTRRELCRAKKRLVEAVAHKPVETHRRGTGSGLLRVDRLSI